MKKHYRMYASVLLLLYLVYVAIFIVHKNNEKVLRVNYLDVGQGDSIYIQTPSGKDILIDAGKDRSAERELSRVMNLFDRKINIIIATHPDLDHIGGMTSIIKRFDSDLVLLSGVESDNGAYDILEQELIKQRLQGKKSVVQAFVGQTIDFGDGVTMKMLFPQSTTREYEDTNSASVVTLLSYGETDFLLTGDAPKEVEMKVLELLPKDVEVLKLGHHGSDTSTSRELLEKITPDTAIVSAGKDNSYGHPHQSVLNMLETYKIKILRTYELGTITLVSDGTRIIQK